MHFLKTTGDYLTGHWTRCRRRRRRQLNYCCCGCGCRSFMAKMHASVRHGMVERLTLWHPHPPSPPPPPAEEDGNTNNNNLQLAASLLCCYFYDLCQHQRRSKLI